MPPDEDLTRRLLQGTLELLASRGLDGLDADALASWTGAGTAAVHLRWGDMGEAAAAALGTCVLIPQAPDTGSLQGDLSRLLRHLARPLTRQEHAAAALLGQARHDTRIQRALEEAVVLPLAGAFAALIGHHTGRGHVVAPAPRRLSGTMVQTLWWDRYLTRQPITTASHTDRVVDQVLVPLLGRAPPPDNFRTIQS
ncbi:TetR-like C-terminal domain-containing protein [Klenkia sp. PcliD-1-E]|uniref:TetR-like C-terminal domain-containing protein n=1 Tax=Klenkia sp. PcliD-1-E TaxID=2954492 RepID=UPI00209716DD|nr:TetR-like C-terminal domain-containing protein [Klenkia sp. PcliD-1-E]MCO7220915.1 TetR/AcrR family transcriptional regulator C-terminal ligand-binding domain-containing protein [Klenkia sp. PcliD-1-E]